MFYVDQNHVFECSVNVLVVVFALVTGLLTILIVAVVAKNAGVLTLASVFFRYFSGFKHKKHTPQLSGFSGQLRGVFL